MQTVVNKNQQKYFNRLQKANFIHLAFLDYIVTKIDWKSRGKLEFQTPGGQCFLGKISRGYTNLGLLAFFWQVSQKFYPMSYSLTATLLFESMVDKKA